MRFKIEKSSIFLIAIITVLLGIFSFFFISLKTDAITEAVKNDRIIKILYIVEDHDKPLFSNVLMYYPVTRRSAIMDIPPETAQKITSLSKIDRLDTVYDKTNINAYRNEIEILLGCDVSLYVVMNIEQFEKIIDLMDGIDMFIPNDITLIQEDKQLVLLPSGAVRLDGKKTCIYTTMNDPNEPEADKILRIQKIFHAYIKRLSETASELQKSEVFSFFIRNQNSNIQPNAMQCFLDEIKKIDLNRIIPLRVSGDKRNLDGKIVLFPKSDSRLVKDIIKQTLNVISDVSNEGSRVYTIEVLNGTETKGLAKIAADLYQSFGFDVIFIGNAPTLDYTKTTVYDRLKSPEAVKKFAEVVDCNNILTGAPTNPNDTTIDFTIIIGKDFDGRHVK